MVDSSDLILGQSVWWQEERGGVVVVGDNKVYTRHRSLNAETRYSITPIDVALSFPTWDLRSQEGGTACSSQSLARALSFANLASSSLAFKKLKTMGVSLSSKLISVIEESY